MKPADWNEYPFDRDAAKGIMILHQIMMAQKISGKIAVEIHYQQGVVRVTKVIGPDMQFKSGGA